jgi:hypothetical protein
MADTKTYVFGILENTRKLSFSPIFLLLRVFSSFSASPNYSVKFMSRALHDLEGICEQRLPTTLH